jgi:hypothetical protein
VAYWNGNWEALTVQDGTITDGGKTLSGGGSVTWLLPVDWMVRAVNGSTRYYWAKVTVSATPTSAKAGQLGVIRASSLRAPATFRTLQLIFQEAPTGGDGPWRDKAEFYRQEADAALQRALLICGGEFDSDESDEISVTEAAQTAEEVSTGLVVGAGLMATTVDVIRDRIASVCAGSPFTFTEAVDRRSRSTCTPTGRSIDGLSTDG